MSLNDLKVDVVADEIGTHISMRKERQIRLCRHFEPRYGGSPLGLR